MMYHVIFFDLSTSHVTSHVTNPDTRLLTPTFPLWFTDTITRLGCLPNWDIGLTSYLGNTPIWKSQNSNDWKTWWPDCDRRHHCIRSEHRGGSRRGSINWEKGANRWELVADFLFLNVEEASNMLDHLLMGESQFVTGRTVRRGRSDKIGGVASTVDGRGRMRWDKNGGG